MSSLRVEIMLCLLATRPSTTDAKTRRLIADFCYSPVSEDSDIHRMVEMYFQCNGLPVVHFTQFKHQPTARTILWKYGPLSFWDVSRVKNMKYLFANVSLQRSEWKRLDLARWDTSNVITMEGMFMTTLFNGNVNSWNVAKVQSIVGMFAYNREFNQPLDSWNPANLEKTDFMFRSATKFNQPLDSWNLPSLLSAKFMFMDAVMFNGSVDNWFRGERPRTRVVEIQGLFAGAKRCKQEKVNWLPAYLQCLKSEEQLMRRGRKMDKSAHPCMGMFYNTRVSSIQYTGRKDTATIKKLLYDSTLYAKQWCTFKEHRGFGVNT